jgi:hypothetical protein
MDDRKKITAAVSAVTHYIKTEEEMAAMSLASPHSIGKLPHSLWCMNGRQIQMQTRSMMAMKAFHGRRTGR